MPPEQPTLDTKIDDLDLPAKGLKQPTNIAELYPEKYADYFISQRMYNHLLVANNDRLMDEVISGQRIMIPGHQRGWLYPSVKGTITENFKAKPGYKKISVEFRKLLNQEVLMVNPNTKKKETKSMAEHIADQAMFQAAKKGNFKHLGIILERTEGKVKDKLEVTDMGLASALRRMDKEDDSDQIDSEDDEDLEDEE